MEPRIARIWRGRTPRHKANAYARYLYEHGIKPLEEEAVGVQLFREDRETETEFVTISYWESVDAMSRFAGPDPRRIRHLERDPEFLIELPESVQILNVIATSARDDEYRRDARAHDGERRSGQDRRSGIDRREHVAGRSDRDARFRPVERH